MNICDSDERWLIINRDDQLGTIEINPAVRSGVAWHQVARELHRRPHKVQITSHGHNWLEEDSQTRHLY